MSLFLYKYFCDYLKSRTMQPRIYTYKITFEEVPYYYYGSKKEKYFNQPYLGSPKANKWCWELYTPQKQILEIFENSGEGYKECRRIEDRLIKPVLNDPYCLNESCGGTYSTKILKESGKKGGNKAKELGVGICGFTREQRSVNGKKTKELGVGIYSMTTEERRKIAKENEKNKVGIFALTPEERTFNSSQSGKISGKVCFEKGSGIFGMNPDNKKEAERKGGRITASKLNSQKWMCLETGHITTSGPLTRYQKTRNIDTTKRMRLK